MPTDDKKDDPPPQQINVTSHNQMGGITAHTVHVGQQQRSLAANEALQADLLTLPKEKPIRITAAGYPEPVAFAYEIHAFLKAKGFPMKEPNGITRILNPQPGMLQLAFFANNGEDAKDEYDLFVGPVS